jgi:hypothetical protein
MTVLLLLLLDWTVFGMRLLRFGGRGPEVVLFQDIAHGESVHLVRQLTNVLNHTGGEARREANRLGPLVDGQE